MFPILIRAYAQQKILTQISCAHPKGFWICTSEVILSHLFFKGSAVLLLSRTNFKEEVTGESPVHPSARTPETRYDHSFGVGKHQSLLWRGIHDPRQGTSLSVSHSVIRRAARGQKWLGTPNHARQKGSVQVSSLQRARRKIQTL